MAKCRKLGENFSSCAGNVLLFVWTRGRMGETRLGKVAFTLESLKRAISFHMIINEGERQFLFCINL